MRRLSFGILLRFSVAFPSLRELPFSHGALGQRRWRVGREGGRGASCAGGRPAGGEGGRQEGPRKKTGREEGRRRDPAQSH